MQFHQSILGFKRDRQVKVALGLCAAALAVQPAKNGLKTSVADDEQFRPETFQRVVRELLAALHAGAMR